MFVVADHGFAAVTKTLRPNTVLRREGLLKAEGGRITSARVHVIPEGGIGMVYFTDPETADKDRETVRRLFRGAEGVAAVLGPEDFGRYHLPRPDGHPGMADLILAARDGYAISGEPTGDAFVVPNETTTGSHGYLSTEPKMNALFVASGAGIKAGARLEAIDNIDIAPTVARLLGVPLDSKSVRPGPSRRFLSRLIEVASAFGSTFRWIPPGMSFVTGATQRVFSHVALIVRSAFLGLNKVTCTGTSPCSRGLQRQVCHVSVAHGCRVAHRIPTMSTRRLPNEAGISPLILLVSQDQVAISGKSTASAGGVHRGTVGFRSS